MLSFVFRLQPLYFTSFSGLKSFIIATIRLLKNGTFICSVLALTVRTLYGSAVGSFFAKLLLLKFGGSTSDISLATGVILIPGMAGRSTIFIGQ